MMRRGTRRQNNSHRRHESAMNWVVKPLYEQPLNYHDDHDDHDDDDDNNDQNHNHNFTEGQPQTSSPSNSRHYSRKKGRNRGTRVFKPGCWPKPNADGSSFVEAGAGQEVVEGIERISGGEEIEKAEEAAAVEKKVEEEVDTVARRLEELQIGVEEVELSEEQLKINDQAQEDELLAMESIYGDNAFVLQKQNGLRSFQIHIHIELSNKYTVSAKLETAIHANSKRDVSDGFSYTFKVRYLSPIVLTCLLPRSYPSHSVPCFIISVQWLHESKISKLCSALDSLWGEQPGQEILYLWIEWLHSSSLSYLGISEELVLGPYDLKSESDRRALSGSVSPDVDIPSLKSYNEERQQENFINNFHECCICFSEHAGTDFLRLPCHHSFCIKCMKTYADMHVKEGTVNKLQCPDTKCGGMIPPGLLKRLLGDDEFERWESLMLRKTLDSMSDVSYCPRCETACLEDDENHAQCSKCFFSFCTLCRDRRHVGIECMTPEMKLHLLKERQNSSHFSDAQRKKELEMINELLSVKEILRDAKQCPSCKLAINKTEGCNKMACQNCGQYFCYKCGKAIDGYDHFRSGTCELFPQEAIHQWEAQMNQRQRVGQLLVEMHRGNAAPCPNCRQLNAKVGNNNHIFCWACQSHFCYLCRQVVRRASQHFGPKGCKQHSAD